MERGHPCPPERAARKTVVIETSNDHKPIGWHSRGYLSHFDAGEVFQANKILRTKGRFWFEDYFDRYIRNAKHFENAKSYIEENPVRAGLCGSAGEWRFGSAWYRSCAMNSATN